MIKKINKDKVELKFYGEIGRWLWNGKNFSKCFNELDSKYKEIDIPFHCYGGEVFEGNLIHNTIANAKAYTTLIIQGVAASMGSIIMLGANKIKMAENAFIMIHNPSGGTWGNAAAHLANAKLLRSMERNFAKKYAAKTGKPESDVKKYFDGSDHWIDAEEALEMGLIDEIIEPVVKDIKKLDKAKAETMGIQAVCDRFCALVDKNSKPNNNKSEMDKQKLISRYNLEGVTAESSDTAIMEALDKKLKAEKDAKEAAEAKLQEAEDSKINDLIEAKASEEGVEMTAEQKETYKKIGEAAGTEALKTALGGVTPRTPISKMVSKGGKSDGKEDRKDWTYTDYAEKAPTDLEKMEGSDPDKFKKLYKAEFGEFPE